MQVIFITNKKPAFLRVIICSAIDCQLIYWRMIHNTYRSFFHPYVLICVLWLLFCTFHYVEYRLYPLWLSDVVGIVVPRNNLTETKPSTGDIYTLG